jgi:hypothetical protein
MLIGIERQLRHLLAYGRIDPMGNRYFSSAGWSTRGGDFGRGFWLRMALDRVAF